MRQWELFGITDSQPEWAPPRPAETPAPDPVEDRLPAAFWTTDAGLRLCTVSEAASAHLGMPLHLFEGQDLLEIFGIASLVLLDAHVAALLGETETFDLVGERGTLRCRVRPQFDEDERVIGTSCAAEQRLVDLTSSDEVRTSAA